jgi:Protein of unknown function (DUF1214)
MTTTSSFSNYARFVGRVGALAVALGIGVAIADSPAIASAETGSSSPDASSGPSKGSKGPKAKRLGDVTSKAESGPAGRKLSERRSRPGSANQIKDGVSAAPAATSAETAVGNLRQAVSRAVGRTTDTPRRPSAALDNRPLAAPVEPLTLAAKTVTNEVVNQVIPALTPHTPESPVSPARDIGLAALLGWSRRQGQQGLIPIGHVGASETTSNVTSEVTTAASSTLATEDQLAAERRVSQIVNTPIVQVAKLVLMAAWYVEAVKNFATVGGPDFTNLSQLNQAATEYANQSATEFLLLNSNDPKLLLQVNPPHSWNGQNAGGTRIWYDNPDTVYRFTGINGASTYKIEGKVEGYDPADPSTHPTSANANFSVLTGINGVTAANLSGQDLSVRDDGTFTIVVSPNPAPTNPEKGMNYLQAPSNSTILATRNTLSDWNTETPMKLTIEKVGGPPSSLFSQIGGFAIPIIGSTVVENPILMDLVSIVPPFKNPPLILSATETALLMLVTGITGENTYMSVATATGAPNTLSQPAHNAQFLSTQLQSAGYFQLKNDQAMIITVYPGDAEYFVVPVTNDWTITNNTRDQQTSLNNSQAIKNADGSYTIVVSKNDPGVANWVSTGGLNQGTISMRFQGVDPASTNNPRVTTRVVKLSEVQGIVNNPADPNYNPEQLDYDRAQQIAERQAGYDRRYTV